MRMGAYGRELSRVIAAILVAAMSLAFEADAQETVKIAFIGPLTGPNAAVGLGIRNSFKLAIDQAGSGGTISGHKLPDGLMNIIPGTLASKITAPGYPEIARLPVPDIAQSRGAAVFTFTRLGIKKAAVLWDRTGFGEVLSTAYIDNFKKLGGEVILYDGFNVGEKDFKPLLTRIKGLDPGMVFCGCLYTEAALLKKQMHELQMTPRLMGSSGIDTPTFFQVAGAQGAEGALAVRVNDPVEKLPGGPKFIKAYEAARFGEPFETWGPHGYVAGEVIAFLMKEHGAKRPALIKGLHAITKNKPVETIFGRIWFDDHGQMHPMVLNIVEGKNGAFSIVERIDVTE